MGMPEIIINFVEKANTVKSRSARGIACVVLKDATVNGVYTYKRYKYIKENYSTENKAILKDCFDLGVKTLVVCAISEADTVASALTLLEKVNMNYLAFAFDVTADQAAIKEFVTARRENNRKLAVVMSNFSGNHEGIINFTTDGIKVNSVAMSTQLFTVRVACVLACTPQTQSATYHVFEDVTAITDKANDDTAIDAGELILINDGEKIKLGRAVNSLTTITLGKKDIMKKIKIVEGMDLVSGDIYTVFRDNYIGKVNNDYSGKMLFVAECNEYLRNLVKEGVLNADASNYIELDLEATRDYLEVDLGIDTSNMEDEAILKHDTGSRIFLTGSITLLDAMEDLELNLYF